MTDPGQEQAAQTVRWQPPQAPAKRTESPGLTVIGGTGGTYARYQDLETLAKLSEEVGASLAGIRSKCHDVVVDGDVLKSALLNPDGFRRFETTLLGAIDGPKGLTWLAADLQAQGPLLRTAANSYRALDEGYTKLFDSVAWAQGVGIGALLGITAPVSVPALAGLGAGVFLAGSALGVDWEKLVANHPGVAEGIVRRLPGLITGLPLGVVATDVPSGARIVGMLYPDGEPHVEQRPVDSLDQSLKKVPTGVEDVLKGLDKRNEIAVKDHQGQIDVRVITQPDGTKAYIVDIPGTKDPNVAPLQHYKYLNDASTNVHSLGGEQTAYGQGIAKVLEDMGVPPNAPVMLVGHSQGGIVAAQLASDADFSSRFKVTHVVTAASPIAHFDIPAGTKVLALENVNDIVPRLDGAENPDRPNWTTVKFDQQNNGIVNNHAMQKVYTPVGSQIDGSDNASIKAFRESAGVFFSGNGKVAETQVYEITREKPAGVEQH